MKPVDLRTKPLSDFYRCDADGYAQQPDLRAVFDKHASFPDSRDLTETARDALTDLLELYGYARGIDESLQPDDERWALDWHIPYLIGGILDYADIYGAGIAPGEVSVQDWVRLGTDDSVRDFREAFEQFCATPRGREAHLLLWRCAASLCRICEDHCWTHLTEFHEPVRVEVHPLATADDIARVTTIPADCGACESVLDAFGCTAPDTDAAAALQAIAELHAAAELHSSAVGANLVFARSGSAEQTLAAFSDFCMVIRQKSTDVFRLYSAATAGYDDHCAWTAELTEDGKALLSAVRAASQSWPCWRAHWPETQRAFAQSAVLAMRTWCNLLLDPRCKLLGPIMAWMHHCLRLHCEWKIAEEGN